MSQFSLGLTGLLLAAIAGILATPIGVQSTTPARADSLCPADLDRAIALITSRPELARSRWGILVQAIDGETPLLARQAEQYFTAASSVKLLTTAAALQKLGADYRIRTSVYGVGSLPNLRSLQVVGRGDPSLTTAQLQALVTGLKEQGVRKIEELVIYSGYLVGSSLNPTWEWEDIYASYATSVNSLILNGNSVTLTLSPTQPGRSPQLSWSDPLAARQWQVINGATTTAPGSPAQIELRGELGQPVLKITGELPADGEPEVWNLAIRDPDRYFLDTLRQLLTTAGIDVNRDRLVNAEPALGQELGAIASPPLPVLMADTNGDSNNLYAEALLKQLGAPQGNNGLDTLSQTLTELGVNPESYRLADGSGLSRHSSVAPQALVQTLRLMAQSPQAQLYRDSLAVAGETGTLTNRFRNTPLQGQLQGKTGTLNGVVALSGYLDGPNLRRSPLASWSTNQRNRLPWFGRRSMKLSCSCGNSNLVSA
ncbi:MAG: D-alanyl-D-alanine carboxypeptidase/D-alanyl-D-alanine-endopeptidase [Chloroflexaceae bacterium]|nr:D-alanyl-D-alanine carboxypeptidase/D-alanyl-D-alanine-endopeptidase [Chloroflexaceae bacterium]